METINCLGDVCPIPVVKVKKAIEAAKSNKINILVDNPISFENVRRFVEQRGHGFSFVQDSDVFTITVEVHGVDIIASAEVITEPSQIVVFSSEFMGSGDDDLGRLLMKGYIFALTQLDVLPECLIFYNGGVKLCLDNSHALHDLQALEQTGVRLLACGTCLNFFDSENRLAVGQIANMYEIAQIKQSAAKVLRP